MVEAHALRVDQNLWVHEDASLPVCRALVYISHHALVDGNAIRLAGVGVVVHNGAMDEDLELVVVKVLASALRGVGVGVTGVTGASTYHIALQDFGRGIVLRLVRVFQAILRRERHDGVGQFLPFPREPNALYEMDMVE